MCNNNEEMGGKFYSLLSPDSLHKKTILEIESALSIDKDFPAEDEFSDHLLTLLSYLEPQKKQNQWLKALTEIQTTLKKARTYIKTDSFFYELEGGPPIIQYKLAEHFDTYPLPAFFLQPTIAFLQPQAKIIQSLWLSALLNKAPKHELNRSADLLRVALTSVTDDHEFFMDQVPWGSLENLRKHIKTLNSLFKAISENNESEAVAALRWLTTFVHSKISKKLVISTTSKRKKNTFLGVSDIPSEPLDGGDLVVHKFIKSLGIDDEPPEFINLFAIQLTHEETQESAEDDLAASEDEVEQRARESRYWLIRHEKLVPTDYGRFTMPERKQIAKFINDEIVSSDHSKQIAAGLIGTMYLTGLSLEDLLQTSFGGDQTFARGGVYRRKIRLAQDAFTPNEIQLKDIAPFTTVLTLQLPQPIASWLDNLYMLSNTLGQSLNLELEDAKKHVYAALKVLRAKGCYQRIRAERIPAALAIETTLMFRDPLITFLLASKPTQGAPKLSYYVAHSAKMLAQCYEQITKKMVSL